MNSRNRWEGEELERAERLAAGILGYPSGRALVAVRAPGRVNLIGEHTDYSGLPVLPVAIDRSMVVVARARDDRSIEVENADSAYPARHFVIDRKIPPYPPGDWGNYVKAAIQGVIDHFMAAGLDLGKFRGATLRIDGRVPEARGLSSSAALTVASTLAFMAVNGLELPPVETAAMVARGERYVGTMAGGMDQAVSILAEPGHALFIEFNPLRVKSVGLPPDAALIVADSLEVADKSGRVREEYNRRVVECSIAARILGRALGIKGASLIGDVTGRLDGWRAEDLVRTLARSAPERLVGGIAEAAKILGVAEESLQSELLGHGGNGVRLYEGRPLEILRRARHVLSETGRVTRAVEALSAGRLDEVGELMNASHQSLRDDFEASTERLDRMVELARGSGALGARLTGAGFGGCIIALSLKADAETVLDALRRGYYAQLSASPADPLCTVVRASAGASLIELSKPSAS